MERAFSEQIAEKPDAVTDLAAGDASGDLSTKPHGPRALREPWLALESWEIDEDLRHMQRLLRGRQFTEPASRGEALRIDAVVATEPAQVAVEPFVVSVCTGLARILLLLGLTTLACGISLLAWWHFGSRPDLCAPGLGCTIAGQALLMIGLAVQPERSGSKANVTVPAPSLADHPLLRSELGQPESEKH